MNVQLEKILPNPQQPRITFDEAELESLTESIRQYGVINPVAVEDAGEFYILIDGERRVRAARLAGLVEIPASVRPGMNGNGEHDRLVMALAANIQRANMDVVEEGRAFLKLREMGLSIDEISKQVGLSEGSVRNRIELLDYDPEIQKLIATGKLPFSMDALRALNRVDEERRVELARGFANKRASNRTIVAVCSRIANNETYGNNEKLSKNGPPAVQMAIRHKKDGNFDITNLVGHLKPPEVEAAALETCKSCSLYDMASASTCRTCPATELLKRLMK